MLRTSIRSRVVVSMVLASILILSSAQLAFAAVLGGELLSWSPVGNASTHGWTTVYARANYGTAPMRWGPSVRFRADNDRTAFYDVNSSGQSVKMSRNRFFKRVRRHHAIEIRWVWRTDSHGRRYRYIKSIRGIIAG